jgi:hypothetical protein
MAELYFHTPIRLHGVVLNKLSRGTALPVCYRYLIKHRSWDRSVVIATAYGLEARASKHGMTSFFSCPQRPGQL